MQKPLLIITALILSGAPLTSRGGQIPQTPEPGNYLHDYVSMVNGEDRAKITGLQDIAYKKHSVPIVVVTIDKASNYNQATSVRNLARQWFNTWEIGTLNRTDGARKNAGILLLISKQDRKARIELGADWGHRWNSTTDNIMSRHIVTNFKKGEFSTGIFKATQALKEMAAMDPAKNQTATVIPKKKPISHQKKAAPIYQPATPENSILTTWSWFNREITLAIIGIGAITCFMGIFVLKSNQTATVMTGISLIGFAIIPLAVLILWALYLLAKVGAFDNYDASSSSSDTDWSWTSSNSFSSNDSNDSRIDTFSSSWSSNDSDSGGWSGGGGSDGEW